VLSNPSGGSKQVLGDERAVESPGGYRPYDIDISLCHVGQLKHNPLECSGTKRHPNKIARNHARSIGNGIRKRAGMVVGKVDRYFGEQVG
jgi:hypothetical protein